MNFSTTLARIVSLSIDERLRLAEAIWESISSEPGQPELTEAQQQELERRLQPIPRLLRILHLGRKSKRRRWPERGDESAYRPTARSPG